MLRREKLVILLLEYDLEVYADKNGLSILQKSEFATLIARRGVGASPASMRFDGDG